MGTSRIFRVREKNNARSEKLTELREQIIDSLGIEWNSWSEFRGLDEDAQMTFLDNRRKVMKMANDQANTIEDFPPAVNVSDFIDHVDYLVGKIGVEHVGISSDFDGGGGVEGWNDASETFNVTLELVQRGYSEKEIGMLWSGNLLRVLDEVEKVASTIQSEG